MQEKYHYRTCNYCEAMCGLKITYTTPLQNESDIKIEGDKLDAYSQGYICPKSQALASLYFDKEKLKYPHLKVDGVFQEISWDKAYEIVEKKIKKIQSTYGKNSVATYLGNPIVHNMGMMLFIKTLTKAIGSQNIFSATSMDQLPHHFVSHFMFGHEMRIAVPDINNTEYLIIIGANPLISNGSMMSASGTKRRLKHILDNGGEVVVIDPRKTPTAKVASSYHAIEPETDLYLLLALLHIGFRDDLIQLNHLKKHVKNFDSVESIAKTMTPKEAALLTGIDEKEIERVASGFYQSKKAVIYGRMGVSTQRHGGLNQWLINLLNILSGNFDTQGGTMFPTPAISLVRDKKQQNIYGRYRSRVSGLKEFAGELPITTMIEEFQTKGDGQIKAFFTICGNPVLSSPNGASLDRALEDLEFMVSIDNYINETTRHADLILPTPSGLEIEHYDLIFHAFSVSNHAKYSEAMVKIEKDRPYDWQVLKTLAQRIDKSSLTFIERWLTPRAIINLGLLTGVYGKLSHPKRLFSGLSLKKLIDSQHGIDLGALKPSIPKALTTADKKINLAPKIFLDALDEALREKEYTEKKTNSFKLIGRRELNSNNTWMHQAPNLSKSKKVRCTALMHPKDAELLQIEDGEMVSVSSDVGEIKIAVELTEEILQGVISIPHGFGHTKEGTRISHAKAKAGVSVNDITNNKRIDPLTSTIAFFGQSVVVEKITQGTS